MIIQKNRCVNFDWKCTIFRNKMPSIKHFSTSIKPSRTFHVECDVSSINRRRVPYDTRLKSNFDRLLYIIFFITHIHTVCLVSINGEASRVRPSKKKNFGKKIWKKKLKKNFETKILGNIFENKFWKKVLTKKCWKNKLQNKNIHNQNLSNIDKCHTSFCLLAPFDKTRRKTGKTSVVYDSK